MEVPGLIGNADVFCYAVVNPSLSGNNLTHLAYGAAICKYEAVAGYYLFYCDDNWKEYADTWHETIVKVEIVNDVHFIFNFHL
jgi:hypothetical protein